MVDDERESGANSQAFSQALLSPRIVLKIVDVALYR